MVRDMEGPVFAFNGEECIQCHACEAACKSLRSPGRGVALRRVRKLWEGRYPDVRMITVSESCMHCASPACAAACPSGAITKRPGDGIVAVDATLCTGCRNCHGACPIGAPQFGADGIMQKCDFCAGLGQPGGDPQCVRACPTGALGVRDKNP